MKKTLMSLACAAALVPVCASAATESMSYADTDVLSFTAMGDTFSAVFSWADLVSTMSLSGGTLSYEADGIYGIKLTKAGNGVVAAFNPADVGDVAGVATGSVTKTFSGLTAGESYKITFDGAWQGSGLGMNESATPWVSVSAVPEPETYAMMLAGLGLVGTMVRRRRAGR